jgi:hypothetical protein
MTLITGLFGLFVLPVERIYIFVAVVGFIVFGLVSVSLIAKRAYLTKIYLFPFVLGALFVSFTF